MWGFLSSWSRFFKKKNLPIGKHDFEPIMDAVAGAAISLLVKVHVMDHECTQIRSCTASVQ
eukprot:4807487-Amphidinium_carterae.1